MTFNLLLDSNLARRQYGIGEKQKTHDFTINFHPPIRLDLQSRVEQTDHHQLLLVQHCRSLRKQ